MGQPGQNFIVKFKRCKNYLRIIPGWKLQDYGLKEGSELHIEMIETSELEEKKRSHTNSRYLNNILGINRMASNEMDPVKETPQEEEE